MQSVSSAFTSHCQQNVRSPSMRIDVAWDGERWTNESLHLESYSYDISLNVTGTDLVPNGRINTATVTLNNNTRRFSPLAISGDGSIRSYISGASGLKGKEVRLYQGFDVGGATEYVRVFTGVVKNWREDDKAGKITLYLGDIGYKLIQQRASTPVEQNTNVSEWIGFLASKYLGLSEDDMLIDTATETIPWAWLDDDSVLEEIWSAAASTGGFAYFDQLGRLRFERPSHWLMSPHDTVQWSFTGSDVENITPFIVSDTFATRVIVRYSPRAPGESSVLYDLDMPRTIRPSDTIQFDVRLQYPAIIIYELTSDDVDLRTDAGAPMWQHCDISIVPNAQTVMVTVRNNHPNMSAVLWWLQIRGVPLVGGPSQQVEGEPDVPPFEYVRVRTVQGNEYIQTSLQANRLLGYLVDRFSKAQIIFPLRGVPGIPQLELGDRVAIDDGSGSLGNGREGYIVSIRGRGSSSGFTQDIDVIDSNSLWPDGNYFVIGQTALGSGEAWY